jgi:hypothetical protein
LYALEDLGHGDPGGNDARQTSHRAGRLQERRAQPAILLPHCTEARVRVRFIIIIIIIIKKR